MTDYKFLRVKTLQFTSKVLEAVAESITNILRLGNREVFGIAGFYNIESELLKSEVGFKDVIEDRIRELIEQYERRVKITSITVEQMSDRTSFHIELNVTTTTGETGVIEIVVAGI